MCTKFVKFCTTVSYSLCCQVKVSFYFIVLDKVSITLIFSTTYHNHFSVIKIFILFLFLIHHNSAVNKTISHDNEQFLTKDLLIFSIINLHYLKKIIISGYLSHNINAISLIQDC